MENDAHQGVLQHPLILLFDSDTNQIDEDDAFYKRCVPIKMETQS